MRTLLMLTAALACAASAARAAELDDDLDEGPRGGVWCAQTETLLPQVDARGGVLVKRALLADGRLLAVYQNDREELVLEHGADGVSCFVALRARPAK